MAGPRHRRVDNTDRDLQIWNSRERGRNRLKMERDGEKAIFTRLGPQTLCGHRVSFVSELVLFILKQYNKKYIIEYIVF